jgi:hypothetical protein
MLRRIFVIAAAVAMLAISALPASATTHSTTHKLSFTSVHGIQDWGTYVTTSKGVKINVCAKDTKRSDFAVAAVVLASSASYSRQGNLGAVAIGYGQTVCRFGTIPYTGHLQTYVFIATSHGTISYRSALKTIY